MPGRDPGLWQRIRPKRLRDWRIALAALLFGVLIVAGTTVGGITRDTDTVGPLREGAHAPMCCDARHSHGRC